jgi:hypothetical protein
MEGSPATMNSSSTFSRGRVHIFGDIDIDTLVSWFRDGVPDQSKSALDNQAREDAHFEDGSIIFPVEPDTRDTLVAILERRGIKWRDASIDGRPAIEWASAGEQDEEVMEEFMVACDASAQAA